MNPTLGVFDVDNFKVNCKREFRVIFNAFELGWVPALLSEFQFLLSMFCCSSCA